MNEGFTRIALAAIVALGIAPAAATAEYHNEQWNDPVAKENDWDYWDEAVTGPTKHHSAPMKWQQTGGVGNSGYVWCPLDDLEDEHDTLAYYPAYMTEALDPNKTIDLRPAGSVIKIYINDITEGGN